MVRTRPPEDASAKVPSTSDHTCCVCRKLAQEASLYRVRGEARIRQTAFGIRPVNVAGGTVKVKDEMKIVFDLVLAPVRRGR